MAFGGNDQAARRGGEIETVMFFFFFRGVDETSGVLQVFELTSLLLVLLFTTVDLPFYGFSG